MRSEYGRRFSLVVDESVSRLEVMRRAVEAHASGVEVFLVDLPDGRGAVSFLQGVLAGPRAPGHIVLLVRAVPESWATAAMLAAIGSPGVGGHVDVVVAAEGRPDMLPVLIADFPALRVVSPRSDPCAVVVGLVGARLDDAPST
ncbi:hypothetical protein ACFYXF_04745 [Streptomyces sp. NPDC002680]|uniref:hypothetical protein n=1 Tax=Streptomyces sp. NPDC002680 TaxID=3364659 RepID=UPI0036A4F317